MTPVAVIVAAFVLGLLLFGFAFWTPIYAIPLSLLFLAGLGAFEWVRRRGRTRELREFRGQTRKGDLVKPPEFSERDRETLYEGERDP